MNKFCFLAAVCLVVSSLASAQQPAASNSKPPEPQLAILDTDIGDDIDDAFALALALRSPELKLLGITTAYGDTALRVRLLDRFLGAVGKGGIPVNAGVATPAQNVFTQAAYAHQIPATGMHADAVNFLLEQIREHPGQITLVAIGPLNNIQAAIERDPGTFRQLKRAVLMSGSVYRGYGDVHAPPVAEWNVSRDPEGLRLLLASGVPVFLMPLDSTQIHLETSQREALFAHGSPLTDQLTLLYHQWMAGTEGRPLAPTLYDPVAVAYAVHPELCPMTPLRIEVDAKGFTRPVSGEPNAQVCLQSDEKAFLDLLSSRLTADPAH